MSDKKDLEVILEKYDSTTVKLYKKILKLQKQHQHKSKFADLRRQIIREIEGTIE